MSPDLHRRALVATLGGLALGACGYSTGLRLPSSLTTVGVEVFGNDGKLPDIEVELHGKLVDSMNRLVHADLVDPRRADLVVRGRIVDYSLRRGIRSGDNERLESGLRIQIEVQLVRRLDGAVEPPPPDTELDPDERPTQREIDRNTLPPTAADERVERSFTTSQEFGFVFQGGSFQDGPTVVAARGRLFENLSDRIVLDLFGPLARRSTP